jgi:phosphoribosylformylglycinamidine synthase
MDFKQAGDLIYIVGATLNELGGSEYYKIHGFTGSSVPKVNPHQGKRIMERLSLATRRGLVRACHDLSEGGLGVAISEMAFAGGVGALVHLKTAPLGEPLSRDDTILFSESNSRFLVEVDPEHETEFAEVMKGTSFAAIGQVTDSPRLEIYGLNSQRILSIATAELKEAWQKPLRW